MFFILVEAFSAVVGSEGADINQFFEVMEVLGVSASDVELTKIFSQTCHSMSNRETTDIVKMNADRSSSQARRCRRSGSLLVTPADLLSSSSTFRELLMRGGHDFRVPLFLLTNCEILCVLSYAQLQLIASQSKRRCVPFVM